jgi:hypothetical protein
MVQRSGHPVRAHFWKPRAVSRYLRVVRIALAALFCVGTLRRNSTSERLRVGMLLRESLNSGDLDRYSAVIMVSSKTSSDTRDQRRLDGQP